MTVLIFGILFWVLGFTMVIWSKRRKYYKLNGQGEDGYFDHVFTSFIDTALWIAGILSVLMGSLMVGLQDYSDATWLALLFLLVLIWLVNQIPMNFK